MDTVDGTLDMGEAPPCQDCPTPGDHEVIVRMETSRGFQSYAVNYETFAARIADAWPSVAASIPALFRPLVEGFLFALRHGPLQRTAKEQGVNADDFLKESAYDREHGIKRDKDAGAMALMAYLIFHRARKVMFTEDGRVEPLDMRQRDLADAYEGIIKRTPQYDALPAAPAADASQIAAAETSQAPA